MTKPRRTYVTLTPEQKRIRERELKALEAEKPELIRWAKKIFSEKEAMLQHVSELLQAARETSGITLEQLQELTGINKAQLSKLLNADGNPTLYTLHRVADALGKRLVVTLAEK